MTETPLQLLDLLSELQDPSAMAAKSLPHFVNYMGADNGSLLLLSDDRVIHNVLATRETFTEVTVHKVRTVLSEGLAGWVRRHRQGGLASDTELDERWVSMGDKSIASALVVPMMSRGNVVGLLSFHHGQRGYFRERHLARAAELAQIVAPVFEVVLQSESAKAAMARICSEAGNPSVVFDWNGAVSGMNKAMEALDIVWMGASFDKSLLPRELGVESVRGCDWDGTRALVSLPWNACALPFRGTGVLIQLIPTQKT